MRQGSEDSIPMVIPKARAFTSGPRDLVWSESGVGPRKIPRSA
jgi:hypothetical protein